MGTRLLSIRGAENRWRGLTTLSVSDRGERKFLRLENGYVSPDGSEIRQWPGSFTLLDLSRENNPDEGYERYITDVVLPIFQTTPAATYQFDSIVPYPTKQTLNARAKPQHLHGFEQIQDQIVVFGESRFREVPIYNNGRVPLTVATVTDDGGLIRLSLSGTVLAHTADDNAQPALNGLTQYQVVYCEDVELATPDPGEQALLDGKLNRRVHQISAILGNNVTLQTTALGLGGARTVTGQIHVVRFNRSNTYDNTNGLSPYAPDVLDRIDDPTSLTSWRVIDQPAKGDSVRECFPAWVANRQRDCGDVREAVAPTEGVWQDAFGRRGVSRRECLELPYRLNPEPASDRIILAAPAYGCLFQVPVKIPADPSGELGVTFFANGAHDKPRSLGIPKCRAAECYAKVPPVTPAENGTNGKDFNVFAITADPANGLPAGTYKFALSYEDDAIGEEGLASETITVEIPSTTGVAYTILLVYMHPGYVMPECLANRLNVYLALPGQDDLAFYCSLPLQWKPLVAASVNGTNGGLSGTYGFEVSASGTEELWRAIRLPLPGNTNDIASQLDPERLAPQSAAMPRGSDAARYVRGVLLSGGHIGNTGGSLQLWASKASSRFGDIYTDPDLMLIRVHGDTVAAPSANMDGDITTHALGAAGRCFPSAYQGIDVIQRDLMPGRSRHQIDRVLNRMAATLSGSLAIKLNYERLRLTRAVWDRIREAGTATSTVDEARYDKEVFYVEPRGQLQVADPGSPNRSSPLFIKFIDPNRGDDITGIGALAGRGVICTARETYVFAWARNPGAEEPQLLTDEFGCVAANSMVEFDGGLAWMSHRGPVAIGGAGPQHVGLDVEGLFLGRERRYEFDRQGMMRHCWSAHDQERGLVMWGMVTTSATHQVEREFQSFAFADASDELRSRFPCDEVLWWSYRTNAFGTWRPPAGREVLWMRPVRDANGNVHMAYLAADGRIYGLDDSSHDTGHAEFAIEVLMETRGTNTTTLTWSGYASGQDGDATTGRDGDALFARAGMVVEVLNQNGELVATTTIAEVVSTGASTELELATAISWDRLYRIRVGPRQRMTLVTTYLGAESKGALNISDIQVRYTLFGEGRANFVASLLTTELATGLQARETDASDPEKWTPLGVSQAGRSEDGYRASRRRCAGKGGSGSPETAVKLVFTGAAQVRVADISIEVT